MSWNHLGAVDPQDLKEARLNLHFAAQVVSGVGRTLLPEQHDDSHTNLAWLQRQEALASHPIQGRKPFRVALDFERFRLRVFDLEENVLFESALAGKTVDQAYSWLSGAISSQLGQDFPGFKPLHYQMPEHRLAGVGVFSFEPAAPFAELSRWYDNADAALEEVQRMHGGSAVRCWPHHFDVATLLKLGDDKSIGVGLSPGDDSYDEPYWYVGPRPQPKPEHWPSLDGGGRWHTDGFVAAVLLAEDFVSENDQPKRLNEFLGSAVSACKLLLT